jgi:hypothetical protein
MSAKAKEAKEQPLVVDFLVHVAVSPDILPFGVADPTRERQDDPWLDLLMARRVGDAWLLRIGDRDTHAPHIRVPTPEDEAREARGGMAAPVTRVGLVYANRLRAHIPVKQLVRHVDGLFLVLDGWKRFFPVVSRELIPWFSGWKEREFRADELMVSENWALGGLDLALAARVKELLSLPPSVRGKPTGHPVEQQDDGPRPESERPLVPETYHEGRVVLAHNNGGCTPLRVEGGPSNGTTGIVCGPRTRKRPCVTCGKPTGLLCDAPTSGKKTCSAPICEEHATKIGGKDFCQAHIEQALPAPALAPAAKTKQTKKNVPASSRQGNLW